IEDKRKFVKDGGLKAYYSNLIKFIMINYPDTKVLLDKTTRMIIESDDMLKGVKMRFSLSIDSDKNLKIKGEIIPNVQIWSWIPPKDFNWKLVTYGQKSEKEDAIIKEIKNEMVFNPEIDEDKSK
ncbi:MAG: hypothetical protein J6T96_09375, partial [Bacteroidales bacterium]|nr:hypothetical protein [Bacteroidales bacterium]